MKKTGLPKFTEKRVILWELVEEMITKMDWYNNGTEVELNKLKDFIGKIREVTTEDLVIIANDIIEHTKFPWGHEDLISFMEYLVRECCRTLFDEEI